jgi:Domain of unknown function (DUF4263)
MRTWEQQRQEIEREVNRFFRKKIDIGPRGMAALQVQDVDDEFTDELPSGFEITVLETVLKVSPACAMLLFKTGVPVEHLRFPITRPSPAVLAEHTLEWIFKGVDAYGFTKTGRSVRSQGRLDETEIFMSSLEASLRGEEPNEFSDVIMDAAGIKRPSTVRSIDRERWKASDNYLKSLLNGVRELRLADPDHSRLQFVLFEDQRGDVRVRPFGMSGLAKLEIESPTREGTQYLYRGGILQPIGSLIPELSTDALGSFESLLNSESSSEHDFQRFFERYPFLLTGIDFTHAHSQPILHMDDGSRLIPDFFLEKLNSSWDVILDLKKPYEDMVTRKKNRVYFKQHVQNAISQLRYYRQWFESPSNRRQFGDTYGVTTFRPKMVIVIGRRHHFLDDVERINLLHGLPANIDLWTYDDLLARASSYLDLWRR